MVDIAKPGDGVWFRGKLETTEHYGVVTLVWWAEDVLAFDIRSCGTKITAFPEFGDVIHRCFSWRA